MEVNESNLEKEVDCVEGESSRQQCSLSFSELRSEARREFFVGKHLRSSLQTCKVGNNLDKLEGLLKCTKSKSLGKILSGLIYILHQLLAQSKITSKSIGFISFEDAYGLYCGFFDSSPEDVSFRDHVLHRDHGLCVIITEVFGKRYILLKNEEVSCQDFFLELETLSEENTMSDLRGQRFPLDSESLNKILNSMDTEYDRLALKAVIFALHSRSQTYELGIKPDRAVKFLSKVLTVADESEKALKTAEDILKLKTRERVEKVEKKIQSLDTSPVIFLYSSAQITPFPYAIATIKCNLFPLAKSLLPLVVNINPSLLFLHTRFLALIPFVYQDMKISVIFGLFLIVG